MSEMMAGGASAAVAEPSVLVPQVATIRRVTEETPDVKTFQVVFEDPGVTEDFAYLPGQCCMLSLPGSGEAMISITSSPTRRGFLEFAVKKVGIFTSALHELEPGDQIGVRGPYGNHFPLPLMEGRKLLFVGGGIGLAPLRSLINYVIDEKDRFGPVSIIYGARSPEDLVFKEELFHTWAALPHVSLHLTVDKGDASWEGHVGFVPAYLEELAPAPEGTTVITCGPPVMIKFVLQALSKLGFPPERVITTLEMKMKCGVGKCGRCNIGGKYVCVDGPVFTAAELAQLPAEY